MDLTPSTGPGTRRLRIGMGLFGDATFDSRVRREAAALGRAGHDVVLVCLHDAGNAADIPASVRIVIRAPTATSVLPGVANPYLADRGGRLTRLLRRLRWLAGYARNLRAWGRLAVTSAGAVDAWHVHDFPGLAAIAPHVGRDVPIIYDSHEIFMDAGTARRLPGPARAILRAYERRLVARTAALVTVNESLATVLVRRYKPRRVLVVHNCPDRWTPPLEDPGLLRRAARIPEGDPVILYHGSIGADRGIEQLLEALLEPGLERAHLVLLGPGEQVATYRAIVAEPRWGGRAHVLDAVAPADLLGWVVSADVGGVLIQKTTLNHLLSTPNKLFECLAAGVPVVASDFPTMHRIVLGDPAGPLGAVCDPADPMASAAALRSILDLDPVAAADLRARCLTAARERWNWEVESARLVALYADLVGSPAHARDPAPRGRMEPGPYRK